MGEFKWNEVRAQKEAYPNEVRVLYRFGFHSISSTEGFNAQKRSGKAAHSSTWCLFQGNVLKNQTHNKPFLTIHLIFGNQNLRYS